MRFVTLALCAFAIVAGAQEDPLTWFPLQAGSRWTYRHEWKSGDPNHPRIDRWTTAEAVTGWARIPEGVVVLRDVRQLTPRGASHAGYLVARAGDPYLIHGRCVYVIAGGWDLRTRSLTPQFRKYLSENAVSPDFCFPLENGRSWGTADIPWRVEPASPRVEPFLPARYSQAIHIFSNHFGSGGFDDVWFQKGIGIVAEHYLHNGTYDEYTRTLDSYSR